MTTRAKQPRKYDHSRWRAAAAVATAVIATTLAVTVAGRGCSAGSDTPENAVREFVAAVSAGDRATVYDVFGPVTQQRLAQAAQRASALVGGSRRYEPHDMIAVGDHRPMVDVSLAWQSGDTAVVDLVDAHGVRESLTLVRIDGAWRIELSEYGAPESAAR